MAVRFISIDDHPSISEALEGAAAGYDDLEMVGSFVSIESVPKPFRATGEFVDVLVVDLNLQGATGFSGLEAVLEWGVPVLVFSANSTARVAQECLAAGAAGYVTKSLSTVQVLDAVRRVAGGERVTAGVSAGALLAGRLSPSDERLLGALTQTTRSKELAIELHLSPRTVDNLITDLYWKVGLEGNDRSRAGLRDWARANGYGEPTSG